MKYPFKEDEKKKVQNGKNVCKPHIRQNIWKFIKNSHTDNTVRSWAKDLNRRFTKEDMQMENGHMKRCSTSVAVREMTKQQWAFTTYQLEWLKLKVVTTLNADEDVERLDHEYIVDGTIKWYSHSRNSLGVSYKTKYAVLLVDIYPREMKIDKHRKTCTWLFIAAFLVIA